jgi:hypothetical protein
MSVRQVNPFKLRELAKASGVLAKNDRLNAWMIASFVASMPTRPAQRQTPAATTSSPGAGNQAKAANPLQVRRNCWESLFKHGSTAVRSALRGGAGLFGSHQICPLLEETCRDDMRRSAYATPNAAWYLRAIAAPWRRAGELHDFPLRLPVFGDAGSLDLFPCSLFP